MLGNLLRLWRTRRWRAAMRVADAHRDGGSPKLALACYRKITEQYPERVASWVQLGNMSKDTGTYPLAEEAYREALRLQPQSADVHLQIGHLDKLKGRLSEAVAAYEQAVAIDAHSPAMSELLALGMGRRAEDRSDVAESLHSLDLPLRAMLAHQRLAAAFTHRRV